MIALLLIVSAFIPEDLASAKTPLPYDIKGSKCDWFGLNCEPIYWEISVMPITTELINSDGKLVWNYTPGLAAEYVVDTIVAPGYDLSGSDIHYFLQVSSADDGVIHQIISSKISMGGDLDEYIRIPLQINQTGTYDLRLFFWSNDTGTPIPLSRSEIIKRIPVNGCMCDFGGAYPDDYLAAYPLQTIDIVTARFYDYELEEDVAQGYVGVPIRFDGRLSSNSNNTHDYHYVVQLVNNETGIIEESLTFKGIVDIRGNVEVNVTTTFENVGYYIIRAQVFDASSKEDSLVRPISELYVDNIYIHPESENRLKY